MESATYVRELAIAIKGYKCIRFGYFPLPCIGLVLIFDLHVWGIRSFILPLTMPLMMQQFAFKSTAGVPE
jgi:hypothetical protein